MNKLFLLFFLIFLSCTENKTSKPSLSNSKVKSVKTKNKLKNNFDNSIITPKGYTIIGEAIGDLNKDKIEERVIICNTDRNEDMGTVRVIYIFKRDRTKWKIWHTSIGAVLPSDHGGMMGDPFEEIKIENGSIVIRQSGGSREKWAYTHRYRFQNNAWELIGATINYYTPEDFSETLDYNVSNGKISYSKEVDVPNKETTTSLDKKIEFINKLKSLPKMDGFYPGNNQIDLPENNGFFYY